MINSVFTGNCVEIMKNIESTSIDLTVTSPPYDDLRNYNGYTFDFEAVANEVYRVTKMGGTLVWIVADRTVNGSETGTSFKQALYFKELGFRLYDTMIWNKGTSAFQQRDRYINVFEYMFVFSKGKPKTINLIRDRKNKYAGTKVHGTERQIDGSTKPMSETQKSKVVKEYGARHNIWNITPTKRNKTPHPAPFPYELAEGHILTWSNPNDIILDPMCGSGTTLLASQLNNRNFIGIDISNEYVQLTKSLLSGKENK
ncbi:DNA methyl transferase [Enterococcus phage vB_EfaS-DELF1]|uniref:site-specific DNA-methyltransferase (cytosine-N(4)-specific) n=1 Tax=Enterococcus phage vB_EfaS-DELF1 TaxID=2683673 RepID=A0A5S9MMM4_9CAUD|nr:DNA methyl transferase [Enterococcus phage vB_EfaS-DELF1]